MDNGPRATGNGLPTAIFLMFFFEYCKAFVMGLCEAAVIDNPLAQ
jgi:hypothetical protein